MAKTRYLLQGLGGRDFVDEVKDILNKPHTEAFYYSAFLREVSVLEIEDLLKKESNIKTVIGIRNASTSSQGLEALLSTGAEVYVVDTGSAMRIFHPKTLVVVDKINDKAYAAIGSSNLTPGGFYGNIENNIVVELDLKDSSDKQFYDDFILGFNSIMAYVGAGDNVVHITSKDEIQGLLQDGRIVDENTTRVMSSVGTHKSGNKTVKRMPLKSSSGHVAKKKRTTGSKKAKTTQPVQTTVVVTSVFQGKAVEMWKSKELKERDLTIPSNAATNPTGSMLMKKGDYDIDQQSYFYDVVFKDLSWNTKAGKPSYYKFADAIFYFIIEGIEYGPYTLTLKYDERTNTKSYAQKQPNVSLSWGDAKDIIKNRNLLDKVMYLYRIEGETDKFLIEIKDE